MKDGGAAFPRSAFFHEDIGSYDHDGQAGMTLRAYIAAQVLPEFVSIKLEEVAAWKAVMYADALIAELEKEK